MERPPARWPQRTIAAAWTLAWVAGAAAAWAGEPTDRVQGFFAAVNLVLADPRTDGQPFEKVKAIRPHVDDVFDVREAAMLAVGSEWAARTAPEQTEFVTLFADLLERSFVWRLAGKANLASGVNVRYLDERVAGDVATVATAVTSRDGNDLRLDYRMVRRQRWVVRDVVIDGISTMDNYHAQFQRIVREGSWPRLIAQLRAKVGAATTARVAAPAASLQWDGVDNAVVPRTPPVAEPAVITIPPPENGSAPAARAAALPAATPAAEADAVVPTPPSEPHRAIAPTRAAGRPSAGAAGPVSHRGPATYWVQVGAFRSAETARRTAARVNGAIFETPAGRYPEPLLRVRVGPFKDRAQAAARLRELKAIGYQAFVAVD